MGVNSPLGALSEGMVRRDLNIDSNLPERNYAVKRSLRRDDPKKEGIRRRQLRSELIEGMERKVSVLQ